MLRPVQPSRRIPLEVALSASDSVEFSAANPITKAAAAAADPAWAAAAPYRRHASRAADEPRGTLDHRIRKEIVGAGVDPREALVAKYMLCGTADDIVQNLPGADRHVWMQYSMLAQFFQVRTSGVGFFEELNKALASPAAHYDLLELMHACLLLGFEGQYRGGAGGDTELQRIRRDVYQTLRHVKARTDEEISPRWRGMKLSMRDLSTRVPLWAIGSAQALTCRRLFPAALPDRQRRGCAGHAAGRAASLPGHRHHAARVQEATAPVAIADTTQLQRIRAALADEIAAGGMAVEPVGDKIVVRVSNLVLFASGKADTKPEFEPAGAKIAAALDKEPGPINVIGHTDNVKPKMSSAFKSNFDLSVARAKSVEAVLGKSLSDPSRIQVAGKGELEPIGGQQDGRGARAEPARRNHDPQGGNPAAAGGAPG